MQRTSIDQPRVVPELTQRISNAAGVTGQVATIAETDAAQFERLIQVNLLGVVLCTKHQIRQMTTQEPMTL